MRATLPTCAQIALTAYDKAMRMNYSYPVASAYAYLTISALNRCGFTYLAEAVKENMQHQTDQLTQH